MVPIVQVLREGSSCPIYMALRMFESRVEWTLAWMERSRVSGQSGFSALEQRGANGLAQPSTRVWLESRSDWSSDPPVNNAVQETSGDIRGYPGALFCRPIQRITWFDLYFSIRASELPGECYFNIRGLKHFRRSRGPNHIILRKPLPHQTARNYKARICPSSRRPGHI